MKYQKIVKTCKIHSCHLRRSKNGDGSYCPICLTKHNGAIPKKLK